MPEFEALFEKSAAAVLCVKVEPGLAVHLSPAETESLGNSIDVVKDRAAAARVAARVLFERFGVQNWEMPQRRGDAPIWPAGWTGSLAHSDDFGIAAIAPRSRMASIGIDIEPAEPLPDGIRESIVFHDDVIQTNKGGFEGRVAFCIKEAVYKAVYPVDRQFLGFSDVTIDMTTGRARTAYGRLATFSVTVDHRIAVLAEISDSDS